LQGAMYLNGATPAAPGLTHPLRYGRARRTGRRICRVGPGCRNKSEGRCTRRSSAIARGQVRRYPSHLRTSVVLQSDNAAPPSHPLRYGRARRTSLKILSGHRVAKSRRISVAPSPALEVRPAIPSLLRPTLSHQSHREVRPYLRGHPGHGPVWVASQPKQRENKAMPARYPAQ
jgi:hypothetical protein